MSATITRRNFGEAKHDAPDFIDDLCDNLRPVIMSVWPEVSAIYTDPDIRTRPTAQVKYPCAIVETGDARSTGEYATDADAYLVPVRVFYATYDGKASQNPNGGSFGVDATFAVIRRRLGQFRRALNNTPENIVKVVRNVGYFTSREKNDTNEEETKSNRSLREGYFEFVALVGESFRTTPGGDWIPPVPFTLINSPRQ